jgi:hypothetical protein
MLCDRPAPGHTLRKTEEITSVFSEDSFLGRHRILRAFLILITALIVFTALFMLSRMRGPHHGYSLDIMVPAADDATPAGALQAGVAKRDITPIMDLYDPWSDVNQNHKYDEGVDTYEDRNGNGKFDGVWIAGFGTNRPAQGVHDPQWVRALALRNNGVTVVMVTLDAIGIYHNEFVSIRQAVDPALNIDHIMFSSTHCHEVADTMKIWSFCKRIKGLDIPIFGFDENHMAMIRNMTREAIEEAVASLEPVDMYCAAVKIEPQGFVDDSRKPHVMDDNMYLWRFTKPGADDTIATFVNWGNHPESLGGSNPILTSDFCHFLREGVEKGVSDPNGAAGMGGMCLYFQGMIGGLMTQLHTTVPHRDGQQQFEDDTFEKAEALGQNLAIVACRALRSDLVWKNENPRLAVAAKTFMAPMAGQYKYAIMLGLVHEGYYRGGKAKTEVNVIRVGDALVLTVPGEIYPEIVQGGIDCLPGRDFEIPIVETPPLRTEMEKNARMALVIGLANDEIGYIIPKTQWDAREPWVYGKEQYGEENSGGPEVAPALYREATELLQKMNAAFLAPAKAPAQP